MSPDWSSDPDAVPYADFTNPQSLNLYGYVDNNPLSYRDLTGLASGVFFVLSRQKRFILIILLGFLMFLGAQYIRNGGETTPLPYPGNHDAR